MAYTEQLLHLPGRHENMPRLFEVMNHPLLKGVKGVRRVFVGHMKTDWESMKRYFEYEKGLSCPGGNGSDWRAQGKFLHILRDRDYLFLRDMDVSTDPEDDVLAVVVTGREHHKPDDIQAFDHATRRILGPRRGRTSNSTAFEDTGIPRRVHGARAYTVGSSVQQQRRVVAPNASLNQMQKETWEEYQGMAKDLIDATSTLLLNVQNAFPTDCRKALAADAELTGQPGIGKRGIYGITSVQANISAVGASSSDVSLEDELGDFGLPHFDPHDSPDHLTTIFSNPDVPKTYSPGAFHVLQLGVFAVQGNLPERPPGGGEAVPYAYRLNAVCYPKEAAVDGTSRFTLASMPGRPGSSTRKHPAKDVGPSPIYVTPEMMSDSETGHAPQATKRSTFAGNGHTIMDREAHVTFMARSLHQLNNYVWRQLPSDYGLEIDPTKIMEAISYRNERGKRVRLSDWPAAPNVNTVSKQRRVNEAIWSTYQAKVRRFIPHVAHQVDPSGV
ncbi:hypothetical protein NMY22_g9513 [Coprinellus aureogranulatus]|nr:hypothetical protein NMY22_g9513 [Coprinellus aureogranulatus]